jgi:mannosyltransferase
LGATAAGGVPLITTAVGGIPEIYEGHVERLLPPGDVDALAAAMQAHLRDPAAGATFGATLRRSLVERFSCETMARTIVAFYEQLRDPTVARAALGETPVGHDLRSLAVREPSS